MICSRWSCSLIASVLIFSHCHLRLISINQGNGFLKKEFKPEHGTIESPGKVFMETSIGGDDDSLAVSSRGSAADTETAEVGRCPSSSDSHLGVKLKIARTNSSRRPSRQQENDYETVDQNASFSPEISRTTRNSTGKFCGLVHVPRESYFKKNLF